MTRYDFNTDPVRTITHTLRDDYIGLGLRHHEDR